MICKCKPDGGFIFANEVFASKPFDKSSVESIPFNIGPFIRREEDGTKVSFESLQSRILRVG